MSRDLVVLVPNGRRVKVHCTADTSILQVLEDVCAKQGFQPTDYDLKHHKTILDLTTTIRFCNLPNKAMLELVETERKRVETDVTIGLMLDDGERKMGDFSPSTTLYDMALKLAPEKLESLETPSILYMRQEVTGIDALKDKTLRHLGLITGRAILRLLNKTEAMQANVSRVYRRPQTEEQVEPQRNTTSSVNKQELLHNKEPSFPGPSGIQKKNKTNAFDPVQAIKQEHHQNEAISQKLNVSDKIEDIITDQKMEVDSEDINITATSTAHINEKQLNSQFSQENLERRLKIEEEVVFLGAQKAIAFLPPDGMEDELQDLPDDFYDLTIEEVRKIYHDLQQQRLQLENMPLLTSTQKGEMERQSSEQRQNSYKNAVVRIQFPDHMILQGIFAPTAKIEEVKNFVKEHLHHPEKSFVIFTTPLKEPLDPSMTLLEAKFVPCVLMHFKWTEENGGKPYLKEDIYLKKTSSDAASILASKYRAPTRRVKDETPNQSQKTSDANSSSTKQSKVPKWFKK
ncbi:tether containing UBX domain for GLUT4 [Papilio machaon]|uniref:tether containing UBX domain for GLUT4 n=1 Tax=Papilio machaon TaxID=76193 RepID=UPI001E665980|nr:tether containing UBX domain for GLUT4 [Papilio machaon]